MARRRVAAHLAKRSLELLALTLDRLGGYLRSWFTAVVRDLWLECVGVGVSLGHCRCVAPHLAEGGLLGLALALHCLGSSLRFVVMARQVWLETCVGERGIEAPLSLRLALALHRRGSNLETTRTLSGGWRVLLEACR